MRKAIPGYEGLYEADTDGSIFSLISNKKLKPNYIWNGYAQYSLRKNGKRHLFLGHRLIASTFIPNPNNYPVVNHIDENKTNNNVANLEWCTHSYNVRVSSTHKAAAQKRFGLNNAGGISVRKACERLSDSGLVLEEYESVSDAHRKTEVNLANISACCRGLRETAGGYKWRFKEVNHANA